MSAIHSDQVVCGVVAIGNVAGTVDEGVGAVEESGTALSCAVAHEAKITAAKSANTTRCARTKGHLMH